MTAERIVSEARRRVEAQGIDAAVAFLHAQHAAGDGEARIGRLLVSLLIHQRDLVRAIDLVARMERDRRLTADYVDVIARINARIVRDKKAGPHIDAFRRLPSVAAMLDRAGRYATFESLGENCELGSIQRLLGVEPMGLFRFAGVPFTHLLFLLRHEFDAFLGEDACEVSPYLQGGRLQYDVVDRRFGYRMHSFVDVGAGDDRALVLAKIVARLHFLRRKLIDDLRDGTKTFVYRSLRVLGGTELADLVDAVRCYNAGNRLVVVGPAALDAPVRSEIVGPVQRSGAVVEGAYESLNWIEDWVGLLNCSLRQREAVGLDECSALAAG